MPHVDARDLGRMRTITTVLARYGFGSLLEQAGIREPTPEEAGDAAPWATRIRKALVELGPTFIKLGQILSVRPDIAPPELMEELQGLQDRVPPTPWEEARAVLEAELSRPLEDCFASIEPTPIASASVAQVHVAQLPDGQEVVLKVQRPGIQEILRSDLRILYTLAHLIEGRLELPGVYTPVAIVQEFEQALLQELDFLQEASNAERFRLQFAGQDAVVVPRVYREFSTSRVMVMERVAGGPLSGISPDDPRAGPLLDALIDATYHQVFESGFFHGDPHPGNLFATPEGRLAFLDFGLCGALTSEMQDVLVTSFTALVFEDAETLALNIYRAGGTDGRLDLKAFRSEVERLMKKYHGVSYAELSTPASLNEFVQIASRHRIRLRPEYAVLARAVSLLDGCARALAPDVDIVARVKPKARELLARRMAPDRLGLEAMRLMVQAQGGLRDLPLQLNQLLMDLEGGRLHIQVRDEESVLVRAELRDGIMRLTFALGGAASLIAGAQLVAAWAPEPLGVSIGGWVGLFFLLGGAASWGALVAHTLLGERFDLGVWRRRLFAVIRFFARS